MDKKCSSAWALIALVAAVTIPALACGPASGTTGPTIAIMWPQSGAAIAVGEQVLIQSSASDKQGIARVELLVNSVVVRTDTPAEGTPTTFAIAQPWTPEAPGDVVIHVIAYNTQNQASPPTSITLQVVERAAQATPTASPTQTPVPDVTEESGCTLNASYVADLTIPDNQVLQPDVSFTKSWRIRNSGTCDWGSDFRLVFMAGSRMGAPTSVAVPATPSGATVDVSVPMAAPTEPGTYESHWRMQSDQGQVFGSTVYVLIVVPSPATATPTGAPSPSPTVSASPTVVTPTARLYSDLDIADVSPETISEQVGERFAIQIAVRNSGTAPADPSTLAGTFPPDGGVATADVPALDPDEVRIVTLQYRITEPAYGNATLTVDAEDILNEAKEDNNEAVLPIAVDPPDLTAGEATLGAGDRVNLDSVAAADFSWEDDGGQYRLRPQAGGGAYVMAGVSDRAHYAQINPARFSTDDIPASDLETGAIIAARTDTGRRGFLRVEALDLSGGTVHLSWRVWDWP